MAFGQGTTGLIVAAIISLTSGLAFVICLREFFREAFTGFSFDRALRKNRDVLLDDDRTKTFVVKDSVFEELLARRDGIGGSAAASEWNDRFSYLATVSFLGIVALAGFVAGIAHFS